MKTYEATETAYNNGYKKGYEEGFKEGYEGGVDVGKRNAVKHGRWEQVQRWATKAKYRCSVCGRGIMSATKVNIEKYPYCHCGADMRGADHDR